MQRGASVISNHHYLIKLKQQKLKALGAVRLSFFHISTDETLDVLQFVAIKVHQEHTGAGAGGNEVSGGFGFLFGAHRSDPAKIIKHTKSDLRKKICLSQGIYTTAAEEACSGVHLKFFDFALKLHHLH